MGSEGDDSGKDRIASFKEGAAVRVRDEDGEVQDATIVRQHRNGDYTVKYEDTGKVEKNVPKARVQSAEKGEGKGRARKRQEEEEDGEDKKGEDSTELEVDETVQFKNDKGEWCDGQILKVRSNGRYDIAVDGDEDEVAKNVERRDIRERKASSKKKKKKKRRRTRRRITRATRRATARTRSAQCGNEELLEAARASASW